MQQDLEIPLAEPFLIVDQLSQLDEADPENIMRDIHLKDLSDVVHDCLRVQVFVYVLRRCLVLVLAQQNRLEDGQSLRPDLPPRVFYQILESIELLADDFVVRHHNIAEQSGENLGTIDSDARRGVVEAHESVVEKLAPQSILDIFAVSADLLQEVRQEGDVRPQVGRVDLFYSLNEGMVALRLLPHELEAEVCDNGPFVLVLCDFEQFRQQYLFEHHFCAF